MVETGLGSVGARTSHWVQISLRAVSTYIHRRLAPWWRLPAVSGYVTGLRKVIMCSRVFAIGWNRPGHVSGCSRSATGVVVGV